MNMAVARVLGASWQRDLHHQQRPGFYGQFSIISSYPCCFSTWQSVSSPLNFCCHFNNPMNRDIRNCFTTFVMNYLLLLSLKLRWQFRQLERGGSWGEGGGFLYGGRRPDPPAPNFQRVSRNLRGPLPCARTTECKDHPLVTWLISFLTFFFTQMVLQGTI